MPRATSRDIKVADRVTCRRAVPAYYSNYGGNPVQHFGPDMVGVIAATHMPCVHPTVHGQTLEFCCVDFEGVPYSRPAITKWRCALLYDNIVLKE